MEIEKRSFEIISHELSEMQITLPADQEMITKRVIHTSADFDYIQTLKYSKDAVAIAKRLISEGADIVTDTNMALSGINKKISGKIRRTRRIALWLMMRSLLLQRRKRQRARQ